MAAIPPKKKKLLKGLNPNQKEALMRSYKKHTLVLAGAGSGKTSVLTKRLAWLLASDVDPRRILTVTFTNKASKEMKQRLDTLVSAEKTKGMMMGTFHSLAVRWLHIYYAEAGLKKNWTIFDDDDTSKTMKKTLVDLGISGEKSNVLLYKNRISDLKNQLIGPSDMNNTGKTYEYRLDEVYAKYQGALQRQNAVDFDDLIMRVVLMLTHDPVIRAKFQARYRFVSCDEYQDTNKAQYEMLKLIVGNKNNFFIVGDDFQSIYGWRGADIQNILNFQNDFPNSQVIKLEQNYRSTKTVVKAGNAIMKHNQHQMDKVCFSDHEEGEKIKIFTASDDEDEARFIAQEIQNRHTFNNEDFKDIAILYRTNVQSRLLEDQFIRHQIPYNMVSGFSFYERREVKDILSWIQIAVNPDNDIACERVLSMQQGIGKTTIESFYHMQKKHPGDMSLYQAVENASPKTVKIAASLASLTHIVSKLNAIHEAGKSVSDQPISDMLDLIYRNTGYLDELRQSGKEDDLRRIDNLRELQKIAKGFEEEHPNPKIQDFLDQIALQSKDDKLTTDDKVQMMTLHTAKGLEFPVVFLIGMEEGILPHRNSVTDDLAVEEERRLAYVGVTRAEKELYMTHAERRMDWNRTYKWQESSRFLNEIPDHLKEHV